MFFLFFVEGLTEAVDFSFRGFLLIVRAGGSVDFLPAVERFRVVVAAAASLQEERRHWRHRRPS